LTTHRRGPEDDVSEPTLTHYDHVHIDLFTGRSPSASVRVTKVQVAAARLKVRRAAITGKPVDPAVLAIAQAERSDS
jgi:hypothetical protein